MKPTLQFIADPATPDCLRKFLIWTDQGTANDERPPPVFANWRDWRVRLVTGSGNGFVGITALLGHVAPQRVVSLLDLSAFLDTPYPQRSVDTAIHLANRNFPQADRVVAECADRCGIAVTEFRQRNHIKERCFAVGELYAANVSISATAHTLNIMPTAITRCLETIGVRGPDTPERWIVRSLWTDGEKQIGNGAGQVSRHSADRLARAGLVAIAGATCDAALRIAYPNNQGRAA